MKLAEVSSSARQIAERVAEAAGSAAIEGVDGSAVDDIFNEGLLTSVSLGEWRGIQLDSTSPSAVLATHGTIGGHPNDAGGLVRLVATCCP